MNLLDKEDYTEIDIIRIIESKLEESIHIEFKAAAALSNDKMIKKEISKDVSAFANSDGGIIFYGIEENNHAASSVSFIDGALFNKEWLENVIISSIQNRIDNLRIIPIRFDNDIKKTIYAVKIPRSLNAPHINADKKFYRRHNFQSIPMEEYEIRNLYLSHKESEIEIETVVIKPIFPLIENNFRFHIEIQIGTKGNYIAEKYKVAAYIKDAIGINIYFDKEKNYTITQKLGEGAKISNNEMIPIFPGELYSVLIFEIKVPFQKYEEIIKTIKCELITYSVSEVSTVEYELAASFQRIKDKYYSKI